MSLALHNNWRGCQDWREFGVPMTTQNDVASKMFDAVLTQYVGWYDDPSVGGIEKSIEDMMKADPNFVMGHVIKNGLDALGTGRTIQLDPEFKSDVYNMVNLAETQRASDREKKHVNAVKLWTEGEMKQACNIWEDILVEYPLDMLAVKFAHDSYFYLGLHPPMRDSIARVFPHWSKKMPLYGYLYGMHAFGLEECNQYDLAEKKARMGLDFNRNDAWSTHSMAHVLEMMGRSEEGIEFMTSTENDWNQCGMIACHNYWHYAVYNIEQGNHEEALGVFDKNVGEMARKSGALLDMVDACSLLYRLKLEGVKLNDKWSEMMEVCKAHVDDHVLSFNDAHILMVTLGAEDKDTTKKLLESLNNFVNNGKGDNCQITKKVGLPLCEAMVAFDEGDYARAVDLVLPVRYDIITIGGSHAQRDVFNQFLIHAALNSPKKEHKKLARFLLTERKALKSNAPLTDRLIARAMAQHCD